MLITGERASLSPTEQCQTVSIKEICNTVHEPISHFSFLFTCCQFKLQLELMIC